MSDTHTSTQDCAQFSSIFLERVVAGGDRFKTVEFFRGARIFDPSYAKNLSREQAMDLIDKLGHYPVFSEVGDKNIVARLKKAWNAYHKNARSVLATFGKNKDGKKDSDVVVTWHYPMFLGIDSEKANGASYCHCTRSMRGCSCYENLKVWWEACELAALVLPSSATAERVFH
mmetsp:Transcript_6250/g.11153  ORF Transcript_6250/g.11153 Transcript_6250/m.11153 type:complete len:173 (-) Transcript_6250:214-732(-)